MKQFDIYVNNNEEFSDTYPYLLNIQPDKFMSFKSRLVVPLTKLRKSDRYNKIIHPEINISGEVYMAILEDMASYHCNRLTDFVCNVKNERDNILGALDEFIR